MNMAYSKAGWGILVVVAAFAAYWLAASRETVSAHQAPAFMAGGAGGSALITHYDSAGGGSPLLTVVDPTLHVVAVYSIAPGSGEITLRGVRNFHYDLQMDEFNGVSPTPGEIRSLLQRR